MSKKIVAIIGSYRKGGVIDTAIQAVLEGARRKGAETQAFHLTDQHIEFCTNCRQCAQTPSAERGKCTLEDDLEAILQAIDEADSVILGSPVLCGNVSAIFRRFMERLLGYAYWPWGQPAPRWRSKPTRKAVLVASSAMPALMMQVFTGTTNALRSTARSVGAKTIGTLWIGLAAGEPHHRLSPRTLAKAHRLGAKLA
jgi:multimeric flavodoxin WrbA